MKAPRNRKAKALLLVTGSLAATLSAAAQYVKLDRCDPPVLRTGQTTEITLHGGGLEGAELWTSFPAQLERIEEKGLKFRITTDYTGPGAIRAHSQNGVSNLAFVSVESGDQGVIACERKDRREEAQLLTVPAVIEGRSPKLAASFYRFAAKTDQRLTIHARSRSSDFDGVLTIRSAESGKRLAMADDSDIYGADPWLEFTPPVDGDYVIELIDSQYRGDLGFQLTIAPTDLTPILDPARILADSPEPIPVSLSETVYARFEEKGDQDVFRFDVSARSFVTITPLARAIRSSATLRMTLTDAEGKTLAETPHDAFDERVTRVWLPEGSDYRLTVTEAFGRFGSEVVYGIELNDMASPFELTIPGQRDKKRPLPDKFLAVPGGTFVVPVQCRRHQFDKQIDLRLESEVALSAENPVIAGKARDVQLRVRVPETTAPGRLLGLRVSGSTTNENQRYEAILRTGAVLVERDRGTTIPNSADGLLAVRVVEPLFKIEVTTPETVEQEGKVNIPVKLVWQDEKRKFNTTIRLRGLPDGAQAGEKKLNNKDTTTGLELKVNKDFKESLDDLRVEVSVDYHKQALLLESEPFSIGIKERDED